MTSLPDARAGTTRRRLLLAVQIAGTTAGLAYVAYVADLGAAFDAAISVSPLALLAAIGIAITSIAVAALRWRILLVAYGAASPPPLPRLFAIYLVGLFYNSYLPGGVGGDVVRGVISRESFGESGVTRGIAVVTIERALGLTGLLLVCATALLARPTDLAVPGELALALAVACAAGTIFGVAWARRLARFLPGPLGKIAAGLPEVHRFSGIAMALALSVVTQVGVSLMGHAVLGAVEPRTTLADSFLIVPLAAATVFLPFTIGGAGAREAAFVVLTASVIGTDESHAAAASLLLWLVQLLVAGTGGVIQLFLPVTGAPARQTEASE